MKQKLKVPVLYTSLLALVVGCLPILPVQPTASAQRRQPSSARRGEQPKEQPQENVELQDPTRLGQSAQQQIQALMSEKKTRSKTEQKIGSSLLYAGKQQRGQAVAEGVATLQSDVKIDENRRVTINITGDVSEELTSAIESLGGEIIDASKQHRVIKALFPFDKLEELASLNSVSKIASAENEARTHRRKPRGNEFSQPISILPTQPKATQAGGRKNFSDRAAHVRSQLSKHMMTASPAARRVGALTSEADVAQRAREARDFFGINGRNIKIGVLSDGVANLQRSQSTGDLPPNVTIIPGQEGPANNIGEGTAMLELIHDLAPGADLFFATAFISGPSFADNIRRLRFEYGCDIIVDDIIYFFESPFQDDIIAQAVNDVTADGAMYFSSAGNQGNFNDGTSGTWEGDFRRGGQLDALGADFELHDFGNGNISNRIENAFAPIIILHWSDPVGASSNDYDLFLLNANLTTVVAASTDFQNGDDDPFEGFGINGNPTGFRLVIAKAGEGVQDRALGLRLFDAELGVGTDGATFGHSAARDAFSVAAVNVATAAGGAFTGGQTNPVEDFSSDGRRRIFYNADGTPITPGNVLFRTRGGEVRQKPDLASADGTVTTVPGFARFFGTSAAAPHAAAIAALVQSAQTRDTGLTPLLTRLAITRTALDIEARRVDRDSGVGIVSAFRSLRFIGARPQANFERGSVTVTPVNNSAGDGDAFIEPGESGQISVQLRNIGGRGARDVSAQLSTTTPGVGISTGGAEYPDTDSEGTSTNVTPFVFTLPANAPCGLRVDFTVTVSYRGGISPQTFTFSVQTGQPSSTPTTFSYTGPPVAIPDSNPAGVDVPLQVSGVGNIADLNFSIDGATCSAAAGATGVGIDHTFVNDLVIRLRSPQGTSITLINRADGGGNNFCQTILDDSATRSIQSVLTAENPFSGTFRPASPLAAYVGENPNGTWTLNVSDLFITDVGNVRAFSLNITSFECARNTPAP